MCERPRGCDLLMEFYFIYKQEELPLLTSFLWDEFKVLPSGFHFTPYGWKFDEPNQYNPLISLLIVRSLEAIRKGGLDQLHKTIKPHRPDGTCGGAAEDFLFK